MLQEETEEMIEKTPSGWAGVLALLVSSVFLSCGSREMKIPVPANYQSIQAITISQKCLQCHQSLSTYQGLLQIVTPGDAAGSELYQQINSGSMPQWSPKLSDVEIQAIYTWIQNGAPND